jgi:hypothetical protein
MMTDLSVHCPGLDDVFQKVRHLLLKEADRLEEKHNDEDKVARVAVELYKVQREQEKEESRKRLARTRFASSIVPPVSRVCVNHLIFTNSVPFRPLLGKSVTTRLHIYQLHLQHLRIPSYIIIPS